jgi:hypothetical protein
MMETLRPRLLRRRPMDAAVMPLPNDDVTPPVTKTYFATDHCSNWGFSDATESRAAMRAVTRLVVVLPWHDRTRPA